jgi:glycosyltransferase involved in cell wall biosynthesis
MTVLMYSRLLWQKGVREYVDAARQIRQRRPDVTFLLAGETDPDHPDAVPRHYVEEAAREGVIEFLGYLERPAEVLRQSEILVFPSYYREGCPRVVLEASACSVPTVAADVPGTRQAVHHGETGLLVPPRDVEALAAAINGLLDDPDRARDMGRAARQFAEREFSMPVIVDRHLKLYAGLGVALAEDASEVETR